MMNFPYIWRVKTRLPQRFGTRCKVLVRGGRNNALVEFEDGYQVITSRNYLRKGITMDVKASVEKINIEINVEIEHCSSCNNNHPSVKLLRSYPPKVIDGLTYPAYIICPNTNKVVYVRFVVA